MNSPDNGGLSDGTIRWYVYHYLLLDKAIALLKLLHFAKQITQNSYA